MNEPRQAESSDIVSDRVPTGSERAHRFAARDREERYAALLRDLTRAVHRGCPRDLRHQVDDLVQEGLLRILKIEQRRSRALELSTAHLACVARSVRIDAIRRLGAGPSIHPSEPARLERRAGAVAPQAEVAVRWRELERTVEGCLGRISPDRRSAVELFLSGDSVREAAERLAWSRKRVENLVHRGLADLRRLMLAEGVRPATAGRVAHAGSTVRCAGRAL